MACTQPRTSKALSFSAGVTLGGIPYLPLQAADQSYPAWSLNRADRLPLPPPSLTGKKSLEGERLNRGWERISIITHVDYCTEELSSKDLLAAVVCKIMGSSITLFCNRLWLCCWLKSTFLDLCADNLICHLNSCDVGKENVLSTKMLPCWWQWVCMHKDTHGLSLHCCVCRYKTFWLYILWYLTSLFFKWTPNSTHNLKISLTFCNVEGIF